MRIAITNAKGGVAKTTSSIYIASVIVSRGGTAVVYDADPQTSASRGLPPPNRPRAR